MFQQVYVLSTFYQKRKKNGTSLTIGKLHNNEYTTARINTNSSCSTDNELALIMYIVSRLIAISVFSPGRFNDSSETRGEQRLVIQARRNGLDSLRTCFLSCIAVKVATRREHRPCFSLRAKNTNFLLRECDAFAELIVSPPLKSFIVQWAILPFIYYA